MMYAIRHWKNGEGRYLCDSNSGMGWHLGPCWDARMFETQQEAIEFARDSGHSKLFEELSIDRTDLWIVMFQQSAVVSSAL